MRKLLLLLIFLSHAGMVGAQFVQQRFLPPQGERGRLGASQPLPYVQIGNRVLRLAPGGLIYDAQNRSMVHASLPPSADVLYTKDERGDIQRLYILSQQEKTRLDQAGKR